jgi:alkanesulfonate monooxygenase SsuD/methylene tetrahydromethanopterin reductase-like flavin-dependent oxidoreductase (luciferase family)
VTAEINLRLGMRFDLRAPDFGADKSDLYRTCLEMVEWGDARGFDLMRMSEHHAADDGYLPSPLVLAAGIAARTTHARIRVSALLVSMHDPIRMAEDIAVLDNMSNGRVEIIAGTGYRETEFAMFGQQVADRVARLEDGIAVMRAAWTGEEFDYNGRPTRVTPRPIQTPGPPIFLAGSTSGAAKRAARIADGFVPVARSLYKVYVEECQRLGRTPGPDAAVAGPSFVHIAEDPERDWATIERHALHETNSYAEWLREGKSSGPFVPADASTIQANPGYRVLTPDQCIEFLRDEAPDLLVFHPLLAGLNPDLGWSSLELFADRVLPSINPVRGSLHP